MKNVTLFRGAQQRNLELCGDSLGFLFLLWMWLKNVTCDLQLEVVEPLWIYSHLFTSASRGDSCLFSYQQSGAWSPSSFGRGAGDWAGCQHCHACWGMILWVGTGQHHFFTWCWPEESRFSPQIKANYVALQRWSCDFLLSAWCIIYAQM